MKEMKIILKENYKKNEMKYLQRRDDSIDQLLHWKERMRQKKKNNSPLF